MLISCYSKTDSTNFQNGDIIFQTSTSDQSKAIQIATNSKYSHMGILYKNGSDFFVYEAIQPVKLTPLSDWIKRGKNGHYVVKRIKNSQKLLTPKVLKKMKLIGEKYAGKNYDLYFEWSDSRIYCSELVWKIYKEAVGVVSLLSPQLQMTGNEYKVQHQADLMVARQALGMGVLRAESATKIVIP